MSIQTPHRSFLRGGAHVIKHFRSLFIAGALVVGTAGVGTAGMASADSSGYNPYDPNNCSSYYGSYCAYDTPTITYAGDGLYQQLFQQNFADEYYWNALSLGPADGTLCADAAFFGIDPQQYGQTFCGF